MDWSANASRSIERPNLELKTQNSKLCLERRGHFVGQALDDARRVGWGQHQDQVRGARSDELGQCVAGGAQVGVVHARLYRAGDGCWVTAYLGAVAVQHFVLVAEGFHRTAGEVPDVGVA